MVQEVAAGRDVYVYAGGVFQTVAPPSAAALHQLPPPPEDFTGREAELEELMQAIEQGGATISGLRGMGGIGKTALALKLADTLRERYPDAQIYLDLKGTSEKPLTAAEAMAHVVRAYNPTAKPPDDEAGLAGLYRSVLDGQRALLLMDNAANAAQVGPLAPPKSCVLLVTSRERFVLRGWVAKDLATLAPEEARALLLRLAPRIDGAADEVARLCGYLPLALCAAGGMLAACEDLAPPRYAGQLRDERQRLERLGEEGVEISVEASFNLSYASLEAQAARVFRQLAVFPGSFDAAAEEAVCKDREHAGLSELVRRSLVEYDSGAERYRLHDLMRLFAASRGDEQEPGETDRRHAVHYLGVATAADDLYLKGGDDAILKGLRLFDTEWANIRAGQAWAVAHANEDEEAAKFCSRYASVPWLVFELLHRHPRGELEWLEAALAAARRLKDRQAEGVHLGNLGLAYDELGELSRAIEYHQQTLTIDREIGDRRGEASALGNLGNAYIASGAVRRAMEYYEQALAIELEIGDRRGEGSVLGNLGNAYAQLGETRRAIGYYEQALAIHREIGDRRHEGQGLGNLGNAYIRLGEVHRGIEYYNQQLVITRGIADRRGECTPLRNLGNAYFALVELRRAIDYYERWLVIAREIGDRRGEGAALGSLGNAYLASVEPRRAIDHYERWLAIARETGDRPGEAAALDNLGNAYRLLSETRRAVEHHEQALAIERDIGDRGAEAGTLANLGGAYSVLGERRRAIECLEQLLAFRREIGDRHGEGEALANLGNAYSALGEPRRTIEYFEQALAIKRQVGDLRGEAGTLFNMSLTLDRLGERAQAIANAQAALKIYLEVGAPGAEVLRRKLAEWGA